MKEFLFFLTDSAIVDVDGLPVGSCPVLPDHTDHQMARSIAQRIVWLAEKKIKQISASVGDDNTERSTAQKTLYIWGDPLNAQIT